MGKSQSRQRSKRRQEILELEKEADEKPEVYSDESGVYDFSPIEFETNKTEDPILGTRLRTNEIEKLNSQNRYFCGYLREPHLYQGNPIGLCALCEGECVHPKFLRFCQKNDCKIYIQITNSMIEEENRRLSRAKRL